MSYDFQTYDVFTEERFTGNPLAVFPNAQGLRTDTMARIANEFNLSETTFVLPPETGGDVRVRIFTPKSELPFAGHPTIGTALALRALGWEGERIILEEGVGLVPVEFDGSRATLTVPATPQDMGPPPSYDDLAMVLGLGSGGVIGAGAWATGLAYTIVEVRGPDDLTAVRLEPEPYNRLLTTSTAPDIYVFCRLGTTRLRARMFAPLAGIPEDPATGSAAASLAGYLGPGSYEIEQGVEMGRASLIYLDVDETVRVGGYAVPVLRGTLDL